MGRLSFLMESGNLPYKSGKENVSRDQDHFQKGKIIVLW